MSTQSLGIVALERFMAAERYIYAHHEPSTTQAGPSKRAGQAATSGPNADGPRARPASSGEDAPGRSHS